MISESKNLTRFNASRGTCSKDFYNNVKAWQMKKEKNIQYQKEKKDEDEIKELKSPEINYRSIKIMQQLKGVKSLSPSDLTSFEKINKNKSLSPPLSFRPALSTHTKFLTLNRTASVFQRLYPSIEKQKKNEKNHKKKNFQVKFESLNDNYSYSINSGKGIVYDNGSSVDKIVYEKSMKFLLEDLK